MNQKKFTKAIAYLLLLILPLLIFISSILLENARGPSYLRNYDPDYAYLINSLNLAQLKGYGVGYVDHPGTPVQVIGALVIILKNKLGVKDQNLVQSILTNPDVYLSTIRKTLIFLIGTALFSLGLVVFKISKNIFLSIYLQLSCFVWTIFFYFYTKVAAEPFLVFVTICLITLLFYYINQVDLSSKKKLLFTLGFSVLVGLGMATKITFIPILFIPLIILPGIKQKLLFIALSIISFFVFIKPAFSLSNSSYFIKWIFGLIIRSGEYGEGGEEILDFNTISQNLQKIITIVPLFIISYLIIAITLLVRLFFKNKLPFKGDIHSKLLLGIFIAMTFQIFSVVKHYGSYGERYLLPSFMLSIMAIYLCIMVFSKLFQIKIIYSNLIYSILIIIFLSLIIYNVKIQIAGYSYYKKESDKFINFIDNNYSDAIKISSLGISGREISLYLGTFYAGTQKSKYRSLLSLQYPLSLFWGFPWHECYTFDGSIANMNEIVSTNKRIIFLCNNQDYLNMLTDKMKTELGKPNLTLEKKFSNNIWPAGESVYEIKMEP